MNDKFSLDLSKFVKKAKGNIDLVVRKVVLDIGTRIVMRSPVGDGSHWKEPPPKGYIGGRFRANWQYGENIIPRGTVPDIDPSGKASLRRIAAIADDAGGKVHFIVNNLPYAQRLEYGWSKRQAPAGMVGITLVEYQSIVAAAARSVRV